MTPFPILLSCLLSSATVAFAQHAPLTEYHPERRGSEVTIGHGFMATGQLLRLSTVVIYSDWSTTTHAAAFSAGYRYRISRVFAIGFTAGYEHQQGLFKQLIYSGYHPANRGAYSRHAFTLAPEVTVTYLRRFHGQLSMYATTSFGGTYASEVVTYDTTNIKTHPDPKYDRPLQINGYGSPLGVRFGRALSGYFQLGFGYKGVLSYGLTYKF